ncbi:AMP-binding protein [Saccharothrix sp. ALI-22-I]|uniref:AMP-binding protein n=1 Tax=Saccharothrix sp. ALI-22-I TaxID=1933778 RepID=UPI0015C372A8|nr:AMP-binding protein [Saccharothrix sp. ALI-22-I]
MVERSVRRTPDAVALRTRGGEMSYGELWVSAQRLSSALTAEGVGDGDYVGVLVEHSPAAVVAILGVVGAGATYVPLDPRWPVTRLAEPLSQLSITWVLTSGRYARLAEEATWLGAPDARLVLMDTATPAVDEPALRALWDEVAADTDPLRAAGFNRGPADEVVDHAQVGVYVDHVARLATASGGTRSVLEIGCGTGLLAAALGDRVAEYVGIDPSPIAVDRCRAAVRGLAATADAHIGFAHDLDRLVAGQVFDVVVLSSVVQFFPGPDYTRTVLREAVSRLAPGGAVVVADVVDFADGVPGDHLRLPRAWFTGLAEELGTHVEFVTRTGPHWPEVLGRRYDVVLRPVTAATGYALEPRVLTWHDVAARASTPPRRPEPDSSAYVIFTSGSSGRPKGVEVRHRSAVNLVEWVNRTYGVSTDDCLLLVTAFTFDLSVYDLFGVLAAGGAIRVLADEELADPECVADVLDGEPITFWDSAPAALNQVLTVVADRGAPRNDRLRLVFLSGDWVPLQLPAQVRARYGAATRVVALGGATEATVWSNYFDVDEVGVDWPSIPYGRPIQNARYYVLDGERRPCPVGEPGDLHIAGVPVAEGYVGDEELTRARFLPDPFSDGGERMYATGDRARWLPEGVLQFLGRSDDQVKVRGYRIELGDVQAALRRAAGVADAVAVAVDGANGRELVAAVAPRPGEPVTANGVRADLRAVLPTYMLPDHLVVLPALPVGPTGKADRAAIAAMVRDRRRTTAARSGDDLADTVLDIVRDVLEHDVEADESFLDAGGHSLAAAHLRARVRSRLGVTLRISDILGCTRITDLSTLVAGAEPDPVNTPETGDHRGVSRAQARALYELHNAPDVPAYQNQVSLRLPATLTADAIESALERVVAAHPVLRSGFRATPDGWTCEVAEPWRPVVDFVDLRRATADERRTALARALREHGKVDWDLSRGELATWRLFRVDDDELVLSQVEHHLVHDGWSLTLLLRTFLAALSGQPLPAEPRSYREYVDAEAAALPALSDTAHFTRRVEAMAGAPVDPVAPLPDIGRHAPEAVPALADAVEVVLGGEPFAVLERWAAQRGATTFELLMAAFLATVHDQTGEDDLVIGSAVSARPPGFEATLGMFVNTVPVRSPWSDDFAEFLSMVSRSLRDAVDGELIPYDALLDGVRRQEGSRRALLYRCMFSAHNAKLPDMTVPGGTAFLEYHQNGTTKTPLDVLVLPKQTGADSMAPAGSVRLVWEFDRSLYSVDLVRDMADRFTDGLHALAGAVRSGRSGDWRWPVVAPLVLTGPAVRAPAVRYRVRGSAVPAVVTPSDTTTHGEFAALVRACRDHLAGSGDGEVVAVDVARDARYCARVFAALSAGLAVMPVDPSWPAFRLRAVLSTAHLRWGDDDAPTRVGEPDTDLGTAYVVHTSGSTGRPKRVAVTHETLSGYIAAFRDELRLTSVDVLAATASLLFDASFEELVPILAVGGTLLLADLSDGAAGLLAQLARGRATVVDLPTALWTVLADHLEQRDELLPEQVRAVVIGGEAYDPDRAARFVRRHRGAVALLSTYGPSECGISVAFHRVGGTVPPRGTPELGVPIPGAVLCVLDESGAGVPLGRPGVLGIAGTPTRADLPGVRTVSGVDGPVHLTGDLVRVTHAGGLDFFGRVDGGLKVRGFRVAPEEVERAAAEVPGVRRAAAVDLPASGGSTRLGLAVVVAGGGGPALRSGVRAAMARLVPDYLLPDEVVAVDDLPVNAHGKVDRAAVRELLSTRPRRPDPERVEVGSRLRALWSAALGGSAPLDADFITAGGDSLSAMRLATAIEATFAVRLRFRDILRAESCAALDELVAARSSSG